MHFYVRLIYVFMATHCKMFQVIRFLCIFKIYTSMKSINYHSHSLCVWAVFHSLLQGFIAFLLSSWWEMRMRVDPELSNAPLQNMTAGDEAGLCHAQQSPKTDTVNELIYMTWYGHYRGLNCYQGSVIII